MHDVLKLNSRIVFVNIKMVHNPSINAATNELRIKITMTIGSVKINTCHINFKKRYQINISKMKNVLIIKLHE